MSGYRLAPIARDQIDEIYDYTAERWSEAQAGGYITGLFSEFDRIARRRAPWPALPASFGVNGFRRAWRSHVIYWRLAGDGEVEIMAVLHNRMDQRRRARTAFGVA